MPSDPKFLIVNADDFGRSHSINEAVVRAHQEGILTTTSLMVNGEAFEEAVLLARAHPSLGVGLHLCLVCGTSTLPPARIPGLVPATGRFSDSAVSTGMRFFFNPALRNPLRQEIEAQLHKFRSTGLKLDHVNGHLNMHQHPTVFKLLLQHALQAEFDCIRITADPLRLNLQLASGHWGYRLSHALIFGLLSLWCRRVLRRCRVKSTDRVFGLLQNAHVDEAYLLKLLARLPTGVSELYSHPSLKDAPHEFAALISPHVRERVNRERIQLVRYQDL